MNKLTREKIFIAVAETRNLSLAAAKLNITQPSVSVAIKKIENEVGGDIIHHSERPVTLTPLGQILLTQYKKMLAVQNQTQDLVTQFHKGQLPLCRIGTTLSFSSNVNPYFIPELLKQSHRIITLQLQNQQIEQLLIDDKIDFAIVNTNIANNSSIMSHHLFYEDYLVAFPKNLFNPKFKHLSDCFETLLQLPFVYSGPNSFDNLLVRRLLNSIGFSQDKIMEVDCYSTMCQLVSQGVCWSLLPPFGLWVGRDFIRGISLIPLEQSRESRHFYLCHKKHLMQTFGEKLLVMIRLALQDNLLPAIQKHSPELARHIHLRH